MAKLANSSFALDFLRRLLCAHSAPGGGNIAVPRGDGDDDDAAAAAFREEVASPARSPCIVARLMGLDAMPTPARDQPQQTPLRRSRSASSAEGLSPPPPTPCCSPRPRVARTTSASFRDRPAYLRRENDEFLLLSFSPDDDGDGDSDLSLSAGFSRGNGHDDAEIAGSRRGRRRDGDDGAKKQRRRRRGLSRRRCGDEEEAESGRGGATENSSPVSVLEARDAMEESSTTTTTSSSSVDEVGQAEPCSPSSDGAEIRLAPRQDQVSRRKLLQLPFDDLCGCLPPEATSTCRASASSGRDRRDRRGAKNAEVIAPAATGVWRTICRLVEGDICSVKWGDRDDTHIAAEVESEILDQLICDELMQLIVV